MRLSLFLITFTFILYGCATKPPTYSIGGSPWLSVEQAAAAFVDGYPMSDVVPGLDQPTRVLHAVPPSYPREARRAGIEGRVLVEIGVDERGNVARTTIIGDSPKLLADAVVSSLSQWKFRPHTYRGVPVKVRLRQPITFKLVDDPALAQ